MRPLNDDTIRELNDELVAVGEAILAVMADDYGPDKADEKFHAWNDVVYDICHRAFERDEKGIKGDTPSPSRDPLGFLHDAQARDLMGRERRIREIAEKAFQAWQRHQVQSPYAFQLSPSWAIGGNSPTLAASGSTSFGQVTTNVPNYLREEEARFLIEAQVREAFEANGA